MDRKCIAVMPLWDNERESLWMLPGYLQGILQAGAFPVMLPLTTDRALLRQAARQFDGFLFTGGQDLSPELYGEGPSALCGEFSPQRDEMERVLFEAAVLELDKPALGICRGIQLFNALLGGTLYQDLPAQLPCAQPIFHRQHPPYHQPAHRVSIAAGSPLQSLTGRDTLAVNSYHHQGIRALAPRLAPMATAPDGLVEAVWMPDRRFVWAVQWHPEFTPGDPASQGLFSTFVAGCAE